MVQTVVLSASPASAEVRGTWLTTTGVDHISSGLNTASTLTTLRGAGLNTAYIEAWKRGFPQFESPAFTDFFPEGRAPFPPVREILDEASIQAHRNNMAAVAWLEYGFASDFGSPTSPLGRYAESRGWLLEDINGNYTNADTSFVWMNPAVPEVRQLLVGVAVDAARNFDLDGIQFDDRLAWPRRHGYDATTNAILNDRFGVNLTPTDPQYRPLLTQLQDESLDLFVDELHTALRAVDPDVWVSLSPSVNGFSQQNYTADWPKWLQQGYFDEVVPQVYRPSIGSFNASLPSNVSPFTSTGREEDGIMGLRFNGSGSDTPLNDLLAMINSTRNTANGELAGHSIWYSDNAVDFADELANFYGGWVSSPNLEPGHRPDPLVATEQGDGTWEVFVAEEGLYRVVNQYDGFNRWRTEASVYLRPGLFVFDPEGNANQLELLRDRRPLAGDFDDDGVYTDDDLTALSNMILGNDPTGDLDGDGDTDLDDLALVLNAANTAPGDLDLDGDVDLADAQQLAANFGLFTDAATPWRLGNVNADAAIDFDDALILRRNFTGDMGALNAAFASIPEPATAGVLLALALGSRRVRKAG